MSDKKNIGPVLGLYPTPLTLVGVMAEGKPNWTLVGHVGIMGLDRIMVSLSQSHYSNRWIKETGVVSVNLVREEMLEKADFAGCHSGKQQDKSGLFSYFLAANRAPILADSPVSMACKVEDAYSNLSFDNFILSIVETYADGSALNGDGKLDFAKVRPVLFEKTSYQYLRTGDVIAKCRTMGKE